MADAAQDPTPSGQGRFELAMASSGIGMAIVGLDGSFLDVNQALCAMFGRGADEIVGRRLHDFTHPDELERSQGFLEQLAQGRVEALNIEKRYLHRDGRELRVQVDAAVMRDPADGRPLYLISQLRDVTAQREAEQSLRQLVAARTAALEASNRQLELFAYGVSHDLRAPLRAIESFSTLLDKRAADRLDEEGRGYLARIRAAADRMSELLDALLELSRATRAEMGRDEVDLSLLADWVGAELQDAEPGRDADIEVQPGMRATGDERQLKVLLRQLMQNAWQFTPAGRRVRIEVGSEADDDPVPGMHLRVRDAGIGFDMRYVDKLFQPFQRLHGPEQGAGSGMGLAIARCVAERHGGRIWAESEPGAGSTFHVWLPRPGPADATR